MCPNVVVCTVKLLCENVVLLVSDLQALVDVLKRLLRSFKETYDFLKFYLKAVLGTIKNRECYYIIILLAIVMHIFRF